MGIKIAKNDNSILGSLANKTDSTDSVYQKLIPYIDMYLDIKENAGVYQVFDVYKEPDKYYHPSSDCTKCKRLLFYEKSSFFGNKAYVKSVHHKVSPQTRRAFKVGHAVHGMVEHWLEDMGTLSGFPISAGAECKVINEELNMKGSVDSVICFPNSTIKVAVEIKTISGNQFARLTAPKKEHLYQVGSYLMLGEAGYGIVLYISKEYPHDMKEFLVLPLDMGNVLLRFEHVSRALDLKDCSYLYPECECGSKASESCPACSACWKEWEVQSVNVARQAVRA